MAKKLKFTLPTRSPWMVVIDGEVYPVQSTVGRLLLQLAPKPKKKTPKKTAKK